MRNFNAQLQNLIWGQKYTNRGMSHFSSPMFHIDILFTSGNRGNTYSTYSFLFKVGFGPPSHAWFGIYGEKEASSYKVRLRRQRSAGPEVFTDCGKSSIRRAFSNIGQTSAAQLFPLMDGQTSCFWVFSLCRVPLEKPLRCAHNFRWVKNAIKFWMAFLSCYI